MPWVERMTKQPLTLRASRNRVLVTPHPSPNRPAGRTLDCWSRVAEPNTARGEVERFDSFMGPMPPSTSYVPAEHVSASIRHGGAMVCANGE